MMGALLLVVGLLGATVSATPTNGCAYNNYRLPKHIVPRHYNLVLNFDTQEGKYNGDVVIRLDATRRGDEELPKSMIALHAHLDIEVMRVTYVDLKPEQSSSSDDNSIPVVNICRNNENEMLVVELEKDLPDHAEGLLSVSFEAKLRDDNTGIYKSKYETQTKQDSYHISTDFKPNRARRAFPCFDEPSFKATFDISLYHDKTKIALANTALHSEELVEGNRKRSEFQTTPPMSTYLVAFVIGEFEHIEDETPDGLKIRAFTPVGRSEQARFALEVAIKAVNYLNDYFATLFPLGKLDLVTGVKHNSVTENWGLIICKESLLLFDPENTSSLYKGYIAQTVVHQVTHQWFGNLVTMKWWNDLWLHEGFAAWMESYLTDRLYPELKWSQFYLTETYQRALDLDSQEDIQPIRVSEADKRIGEIFNQLVYYKSSAVIKFLHDVYIGPKKFKKGIRLFIETYFQRNAEGNEFWNVLETVSELPVEKFIDSWTRQPGHPVVTIRSSKTGPNRLILEQKRCWSTKEMAENNPDNNQIWIIPVTIFVTDGRKKKEMLTYILDTPMLEVDLPEWARIQTDNRNAHWFTVNVNFSGFYRVHLDDEILIMRSRLVCRSKKLGTKDRIGLINDFKSLYLNGLLSKDEFIERIKWYKVETEGSVLGQVAGAYSLLRPFQGDRWVWGKKIFVPAYERAKLLDKLHQSDSSLSVTDSVGLMEVFLILLELNHEPLIEEALKKFVAEGNKIEPNIRGFIYKVVALKGEEEQRARLRSFLKPDENDEEEENRIHSAFEYVRRLIELWKNANSDKPSSSKKIKLK